MAIALWTTLPIAWRRRRPIAAAFAVTLPAFYPTDGYVVFGYVAYFVAFYSAAAYADDRRAVLAVVAFGLVASVAASWLNHEVAGEYFGASERGRAARAWPAARVRQPARQSARVAAAEERARIARELHDVVATASA